MDKRLFKNLVLRIPHRLRDLLSMVTAWSSVSTIFSSLIMSRSSSSSQSLLKVITSFWHTFLAWMDSHDSGRPFKVAITTSSFSISSSIASRCFAFWIFTFFNYFLKAIFWFKFLSSNSLVKESNIFSVFGETLVVQFDLRLNQQWSSWP